MPKKSRLKGQLKSWMAAIVIPVALVVAYFIFHKILGDPDNFIGGLNTNEPLKGNYLGTIYKGGPVVILLISFQIILLTFSLERLFTIFKATGKSNNKLFVRDMQELLDEEKHAEAIKECDKQKGSLANVIRSGLETYKMAREDKELSRQEKIDFLTKELEESTLLELPSLNENMVVISTLASISTLIGLFGTVTGMIAAFSALARVGAPDAVGLAAGISQALVTTALGISTAAVAIVVYNFLGSKIQNITFAIEEVSYSIVHTFKAKGSRSTEAA